MGAEIALPRVDSPFLRTGTGEFRYVNLLVGKYFIKVTTLNEEKFING